MAERIYGVDISKKITPKIVRDAIIRCFALAHKEILDMMDEYTEWKSDEERKEFRNLRIELAIKNAFSQTKQDFDNPTKESLIKVISAMERYASQFRKPEVIKKHSAQIRRLINKIE